MHHYGEVSILPQRDELHTICLEMFEDPVLEASLLLKICCEEQKENS